MKKNISITSLGKVDLSEIELMEDIEVYINISELSDNLKKEVEKAVEAGKRLHEIEDEKYMSLWKQSWCKAGIKTVPQLHLVIPKEGGLQYDLTVYFEDLEDSDLSDSVVLKIDLFNHIAELKKLIIHLLIDKFF